MANRVGNARSAWLEHLLLASVALIVIAPLLIHGPSCGHDFDFHLLNWLEVATQFHDGALHPTWANTPAWNAGEPRFVFYPPLSWLLGAVLSLTARGAAALFHVSAARTFALVPAVYTFLVLFAGGAVLFQFTSRWAGKPAALLASVVYLCNPYTLFTAYERTAYGEMLSMALFPIILAEALAGLWPSRLAGCANDPWRSPVPSVARVAIAVGLLWLSNAPAAVMGCYALLGFSLLRLGVLVVRRESVASCLAFVWRWCLGATLGLSLAAFFLLPALTERPRVQLSMAVIAGMRPADNTLFRQTGEPAHDAVLHTASLIALWLAGAVLVFTVASIIRSLRSVQRDSPPPSEPMSQHPTPDAVLLPAILAFSGVCLLLMLTSLSLPLWRSLPELAFLQFPWRFLAVLSALVAVLCASAFRGLRLSFGRLASLVLCVSLGLTLPAFRLFRQSCDAEDTPEARLASFASADPAARGSEPTDEYTPAGADNDVLAEANPPFWLLDHNAPDDAPSPDQTHGGPAARAFHLHTDHPTRLVLNLRDYPLWRITRNGTAVSERIARADGLLAIPLPAGDSDLRITWTLGPADRAGDAISIAALIALVIVWRREDTAHRAASPPADPRL